ncbi:MAG: DUF2442 domain-containing protein [Magnetococcales bacterium]|nr:DUF2442 domain-containing protein [Magnetococcales bacterium]MBF0165690.1 DUF2442 domain-containing protein [Magnetococcales bacterium]
MMCWVTHARHEGEYRIHLRFNDGVEGVVDLWETIDHDHRAIFQELLDLKSFQAFRVDMDTIVWDNGLDLAPEFLRDLLLPKLITGEIRVRDTITAVQNNLGQGCDAMKNLQVWP